ncbi:MAG: MtrAB system histidine kinase MtrB [Streptosporangiaceae bacterium]
MPETRRASAAARVAARRGFRALWRLPRRAWHAATARWRRSLQVRVVTTTMVVSLSVLALLGLFLMQQIESGLLRAKENAALTEAYAGFSAAQNQLNTVAVTGDIHSQSAVLDQLASTLGKRSGPAGLYDVIILTDTGADRASSDLGRSTGAIAQRSVPERLRRAVRASDIHKQRYTYTWLSYTDGHRRVPGLVVGAPLGPYELYYLFPLTQEVQTLALVRRALAAASAALVLLLAAIAYLVTRQVVAPVREAAQTAERLASGRLEERMRVKGEDELARLASSFNEMASNLQEQIRQLEELSRVQRRFVSDVSHELRTPLSTVRIAADVLHEARETFDPTVARSAELLQNQLDRFEALLGDLLEISRYDAGAATLETESIDVRDLVHHSVADTEPLAERRETRVVLRLPADPCIAEVDRRRVERILRNLLVNAVEHGEGREVIVTAAGDRDAVAVAVRDHGVGLRPGQAEMVFDRFWRADPARARTTGGTGLGLSISREDAQLHGGWLQAWGEPGKGSQFRLSLPRVTGQELRGSPLPLVPPEVQRARGRPSLASTQSATPAVSARG